MVRQFISTIILFFILVVFGQQASVAAEDKLAISNISFVLYSKSLAPGTLNACWMLTDKHKGPGIATGVGMEVENGLAIGCRRVTK